MVSHFVRSVTLDDVPTKRRRHAVTETDDIAAALSDAAARWPDDRRAPARLLRRLIREGHQQIRERSEAELAARRRAIDRTSGALTDVYPPDYLKRLRDDWPR